MLPRRALPCLATPRQACLPRRLLWRLRLSALSQRYYEVPTSHRRPEHAFSAEQSLGSAAAASGLGVTRLLWHTVDGRLSSVALAVPASGIPCLSV